MFPIFDLKQPSGLCNLNLHHLQLVLMLFYYRLTAICKNMGRLQYRKLELETKLPLNMQYFIFGKNCEVKTMS